MKFWQLISSFEKENLDSVFGKPKWDKYRKYFANYYLIVTEQDRTILDSDIPAELAEELCLVSDKKFYLYNQDEFEQINCLAVLTRFGGEYIEETIEKGSSIVVNEEIVINDET